jgi:adenosylcobinamide kinase / adenosylcobinamide-phosphate guanylyltransferase
LKTLFIGGVKSGKSRLAEAYILSTSSEVKPYYLATTEFIDAEMHERILVHQQRRQDSFVTLEAPLKLFETVQQCKHPVLIECVSIWLNNMLYHQKSAETILQELEVLLELPIDMVLVHNEVGLGVIPDNDLARKFVDLSGKAAQIMGSACEQVFFCSAGLPLRLK